MASQDLVTPDFTASAILVFGWLLTLYSLRRYGFVLALFSLGATVLHEACHWLVGLLLNAKPVSFSLWPKRQGNGWQLGAVTFARLNIWNAAFVAFAPLCLAPLAWYVFKGVSIPAFQSGSFIEWIASGYFVACCVFASFPSAADVRAGLLSALMYGSSAICLALLASHRWQ